jgi:hypothetical protein
VFLAPVMRQTKRLDGGLCVIKRKLMGSLCILALAGLAFSAFESASGDEHDKVILKFDTMIGNPGPTGSLNMARGYKGPGAPWTILRSARGELRSDGKLRIHVRGRKCLAPLIFITSAALSGESGRRMVRGDRLLACFLLRSRARRQLSCENESGTGLVQLGWACATTILANESPAVDHIIREIWF